MNFTPRKSLKDPNIVDTMGFVGALATYSRQIQICGVSPKGFGVKGLGVYRSGFRMHARNTVESILPLLFMLIRHLYPQALNPSNS